MKKKTTHPLGLGLLVLALLSLQHSTHAQTLRERLQQRQQQRAAKTEDGSNNSNKPITGPGDYRFSLQSAGRERHYLLHVPRSYDAAHPAPLLMALHGGGGNMEFQASDANYGLITASEKHGFIAVFPNGIGALGGDKLATWNAGNCCGKARDENVDDVGFLRAVVADVQARLVIDKARIYATGMSNGGMMAQRLACEAADIFSAIAPVAGSDNTRGDCKPARPIAVIEFHALDDDHVLFKGGAGADAFPNRKQVTEFTSVPETISRWVQRNQCSATAKPVLDVPGAHCEEHAGCSGGASVRLCTTDTGGHSWPGADRTRQGKAPASQAISANELMWAFFESLPAK